MPQFTYVLTKTIAVKVNAEDEDEARRKVLSDHKHDETWLRAEPSVMDWWDDDFENTQRKD